MVEREEEVSGSERVGVTIETIKPKANQLGHNCFTNAKRK